MKKKYPSLDKIMELTDGEFGKETEEDITVGYMVTKQENKECNVVDVINCVKVYIQNSPVYFATDREMGFVKDVLVFGIVGTKEEHAKVRAILGNDIWKLGCNLAWSKQ